RRLACYPLLPYTTLFRSDGDLQVGTLVALTALLARLYGPLTAISNVRVDIMTALVSFERVFEVLDLEPLVAEAPGARPIPRGPVWLEVDEVSFRYPGADEVSLAALEAVARGDRRASGQVRRDRRFPVEPGHTLALVGPAGAGKTTITAPSHASDRRAGHSRRPARAQRAVRRPVPHPVRPVAPLSPSVASLTCEERGGRVRV